MHQNLLQNDVYQIRARAPDPFLIGVAILKNTNQKEIGSLGNMYTLVLSFPFCT